ncbi:hypothetical protein [Paraburkholderia xenovorans]|jgi:hypothetical protein
MDVNSQQLARADLLGAARTLRFMAATGLRPTTTQKQNRPMHAFHDLPGRDHRSRWVDSMTGDWVYLDEPYSHVDADKRRIWAAEHGIQMATPQWEGLHNPGMAIPHLFCVSRTLLARLSTQLEPLGTLGKEPKWDGESESDSYWSQFVSPGRRAAGTSSRARPMPAPRGVERNGALPYGSRRGSGVPVATGHADAARRASRGGPLPHALDYDGFPGGPRKVMMAVRTTLDSWLQLEYPGDEKTDEQFRAAYGRTGNPSPIGANSSRPSAALACC